jgi:hypothetical protein
MGFHTDSEYYIIVCWAALYHPKIVKELFGPNTCLYSFDTNFHGDSEFLYFLQNSGQKTFKTVYSCFSIFIHTKW